MSKSMILVLMFAVIALLAIGVAAASKSGGKQGGNSSSGPDSAIVTEVVITPSQIPSRIHVQIPGSFTQTSSDAYDKYFVRNDASVIITGESQPGIGGQTEEYTEQVKQMYAQTADDFQLVSEDVLNVNGLMGHRLEFTYAIIGTDARADLQCMTAIFVKDDYIYIITCKSNRATYSNNRETFESIIKSVTIDDPSVPADAYMDGEVTVPETVPAVTTTEPVLYVN